MEVKQMRPKERNLVDGTTWEFLGTGWWILHAISIVGIFYFGAWFVAR
jgi:hypothetical protein